MLNISLRIWEDRWAVTESSQERHGAHQSLTNGWYDVEVESLTSYSTGWCMQDHRNLHAWTSKCYLRRLAYCFILCLTITMCDIQYYCSCVQIDMLPSWIQCQWRILWSIVCTDWGLTCGSNHDHWRRLSCNTYLISTW
jgi:hypothetical protein